MLFTVVKDGEEVSCSSASCIRLLLELGWGLANPHQREHLLKDLESEELPEGASRERRQARRREG
jgi:hypothetical protein